MKRNNISSAAGMSRFAPFLGLLCLGIAAPLFAATPTELAPNAPATQQSAQKCMNDLRVLDTQMQTEGNWLHGSGYGYGYGYGFPVYGYGYGHGAHMPLVGHANSTANNHSRARPGYEIRTLIASATILAQHGQQAACDALLTVVRDVYKSYAAELGESKVTKLDGAGWRRGQIAAALPVARSKAGFRSGELIGSDVVNAQGDDLGDVYDVVMSPQTGKITYLVVGRGGVFGIGERHVPVPWDAFKMTAAGNVLVLDSTKGNMDAAPRVAENHFSPQGDVGSKGESADAFWKTRILK